MSTKFVEHHNIYTKCTKSPPIFCGIPSGSSLGFFVGVPPQSPGFPLGFHPNPRQDAVQPYPYFGRGVGLGSSLGFRLFFLFCLGLFPFLFLFLGFGLVCLFYFVWGIFYWKLTTIIVLLFCSI